MMAIIRQLRVFFTPADKWKLFGIVWLMALAAVSEVLGIGLLMPVVAVFVKPELIQQNRVLKIYAELIGGGSEFRLLLCSCLLLIFVYVLKNIFVLFVIYLQAKFCMRKELDICMRLYSSYMKAPYAFHLENGYPELNLNMQRTRIMCMFGFLPLMSVAADSLVVLILSGALMVSMPVLTLCTVGCLILDIALLFLLLRKFNSRFGDAYAQDAGAAERIMADGLRAIKDIKINSNVGFFISSLYEIKKQMAGKLKWLFVIGQIPRLWLETVAMIQLLLLFAGMLYFGVPRGTVLLSFSLLIAAMARLLPAFSRINYNAALLRQHQAEISSVFDALQTPEEVLSGGKDLEFRECISIENLSFSYVPGRKVLDGFSLKIPHLKSVAFTGSTGSGKSTLVDLILGLLKPDSGMILVDGRNIEENLSSWRSRIGYVPQHIHLLNATISENVAFGVPSGAVDADRVRECLRIAQLDQYVDSLPEGVNTRTGDDGVQLSGGQKQRIGIARALYRNPEILIFDEATSALDNGTEQALVDALKILHGKLTIIMIAHRMSSIADCDLHIHLEGNGNAKGTADA